MKTQVKALVVGGGAVGTSIAYHLGKRGWDTMLIERDELTSGSTWHAAGLLPLFNMSYATTHIHKYSVDFYKSLEEETGLNAGFAVVGNLRMAQTEERMDEYRLYASTAETCGVPYVFMSPDEIKAKWPLIRTEDLKGALYHNTDGYINPADVTMAMAKGARQLGVSIERKWQADAFSLDREPLGSDLHQNDGEGRKPCAFGGANCDHSGACGHSLWQSRAAHSKNVGHQNSSHSG